jgi:hypothetical protein
MRMITKRLDSLPLPPPDFIKMDVEGHEASALRGGISTLKSSWPYIVFENNRNYAAPGKTLDPLFILQELGYRFFAVSVRQFHAGKDYFVPCGWQMEIQRAQEVSDHAYLGLAPFEVSNRFFYQHDMNVFACHESKLSQLRLHFEEWQPKSSGS